MFSRNREGKKMKLEFLENEWKEFIENCAFTDDELELIPYLKRGMYYFAIAQELNISVATVKRRKNNIARKMQKYLLRAG
jgi:DNA-binding NarL/FixJ family response regulator